ncbi:MAG: transposase [Sphingobacteriales bacterium]|nr:transposase [Sphingobacteriales bacterium]
MKVWLEESKHRIEVFFIPPYSPELNAQEYLNQDVKTNVIGKKRPINKAEMRANVEGFMNERKAIKSRCKNISMQTTSDTQHRKLIRTKLGND